MRSGLPPVGGPDVVVQVLQDEPTKAGQHGCDNELIDEHCIKAPDGSKQRGVFQATCVSLPGLGPIVCLNQAAAAAALLMPGNPAGFRRDGH